MKFTTLSSKFTFHLSKCLRSRITTLGLTPLSLISLMAYFEAFQLFSSLVSASHDSSPVNSDSDTTKRRFLRSSCPLKMSNRDKFLTAEGTLSHLQMGYTHFAIAHFKFCAQNPPFVCTQSSTGCAGDSLHFAAPPARPFNSPLPRPS